MGTTTLAIVVALVGFLLVLAFNLALKLQKDGSNWGAMILHFRQNLRDSLLPTALVTLLLWGTLFGYSVVQTIYYDHSAFVARIGQLKAENNKLARLIEESKKPKVDNAIPAPRHRKGRADLVLEGRNLASELASFSGQVERTRPPYILSTANPIETTRDSHDKQAIIDFMKTFSGRMANFQNGLKEDGLDASQLERHVIAATNTPVILPYVAADLNGLADQLEGKAK